MTELNRAGQVNSLGHIDTIQKTFRDQIDVVSDELRQLAGNAEVPEEALNAPYLLYVNPYTGKDTYVSGDYKDTGDPAQRISLQRLECGYTEAAPFRTLSRACLEAAIITSRDYQDTASKQNALVSIVVMTGNHIIFNDKGELDSTANFPAWEDGKVPTDAELAAFNPRTRGGVILPRGASLISLDLRKTILRPNYVPTPAPEEADLSNRTALLRVTGQCYLYGFTLRDKEGANYSHHLISGFEYANTAELDEFYSKVLKTFGGLSAGNAVPDQGENTIVGPAPRNPTEPTDTTGSASPYVYNTSLRSEWGFCGMFADGAQAAGFKSMVVAQYTGVSLQRDLRAWQKYVAGNWVAFTDYNDLITTDPDDVRPTPEWRSFHVRTSNGSVIQEVSVFAIGQAIHHLAESGSQITITNSNSNFGGCAALAIGFQPEAAPGDTPWSIELVRRALDPFEKTSNIKRIFLGQLEDPESEADRAAQNASTTLDLITDLTASTSDPTQPDLLVRDDYSLKENDYVWVENPGGPDYRAQLAATPWTSSAADKIQIKTAVRSDSKSGNVNPNDADADNNVYTDLAGKRVYVRRFRDVRTVEERRYSIINSGGINKVRLPVRDYVIQPILGGDWSAQLQAVAGSERTTEVSNGALVELRYSKRPDADTDFDPAVYYRKADVVRKDNKHWFSVANNYGPWNADGWSETYVHMEEEYAPEGYYSNAQPIITFDKDADQAEDSAKLGNTLSDTLVQAQLRSAVDYQGLFYLLLNFGYTKAQAYTFLDPQPEGSTDSDVSGNNWDVDFRRPTNIRLYSHAYEWAGYNNYSKALPQYQGELTANNKFTFYFTNQDGGKVYASGFNEEGLNVTPRGLEDITTGQVLGLEEIGNPDRDIDFPTVIKNLQITETLTLSDAQVIDLPSAKTTLVGGGEIASIDEIKNAPKANSDEELDEPRPANFITPRGLKFWASWANVVTKRPGEEVLYVVPDNAVEGDDYTFNGVTATLNANPNRNASEDPPRLPTNACYFSNAVKYANDNFSPAEVVQYRLADGPYWSGQKFTTIAQVIGAVNNFPNGNRLADFNTSTVPTTDVKKLVDRMDMPVFATKASTGLISYARKITITVNPTKLVFLYGGSINGIAWKGSQETYEDTINYPDSIFSSGLRPYRSTNLLNGIDEWIDSSTVPSGWIFDRFFANTTIELNGGNLSMVNCVFGAKASGRASVGYGSRGAIVYATAENSINMRGIYFLGNVTTSPASFPKAVAKCQIIKDVYGTRNTQEILGGRSTTGKAALLSLTFSWGYEANKDSRGFTEKDFDVNCIHILDNNGRYGLMSNRAATNGSRGATFTDLIGELPAGTKLYTGGYSSYQKNFTISGHYHGFAGTFGTMSQDIEGTIFTTNGPKGINGNVEPIQLMRNSSYSSSVWEQARTGTTITQTEADNRNPGTAIPAFSDSSENVLNVYSYIWYKGLDVNTGNIVGGAITETGPNPNKIYG